MLMNRTFARRMEDPVERAQAQISRVSSVVHESIDGALIVKTLGREDAETAKLAERADALRRDRVEAGFVRAGFEPALEALPTVGIILLMAVGSWRISRGDVSYGTLVQFVSLFYLLSWPMRFIGWILGELPRAVVGKARVDEVLGDPDHGGAAAEARRAAGRAARRRGPGAHVPPRRRAGPERGRPRGPRRRVGRRRGHDGRRQERAHAAARASGRPRRGRGPDRRRERRARGSDRPAGSATLVFQESFLFATTAGRTSRSDSAATEEAIVEAARLARADAFIRNCRRATTRSSASGA